jgi:hypothetical protein
MKGLDDTKMHGTTIKISASCLYCLLLYRVPSPIGKDQKVYVLLQVPVTADWSQRSADLSQFAQDLNFTNSKLQNGRDA